MRDERAARGWKNQKTARANLARAGISIPESVYAEYESGTRIPSEDRLAALVGYFGTSPHIEAPGGTDTPAGLLALQNQLIVAFETQAKAIMDLVEEMRLTRADEVKALREQIDFAREERRRLTERVASIERDHAALLERVG